MQEWTLDEFIKLLREHHRDDAAVSELVGHSEGSVHAVRAGVHGWHNGTKHPQLTGFMTNYLEQSGRPRYTCPRCNENV